MANKRSSNSSETASGHIRFNALGLALFSAALIVATGCLTAALVTHRHTPGSQASNAAADRDGGKPTGTVPAWGDLVTYDIDLEQPEEYVAFELETNKPPRWVFNGMDQNQSRDLMLACGLSTEQVKRALSDPLAKFSPTGTVIFPDQSLVLSLTPPVRSKLYGVLGRDPANHYMQYPFCYPRSTFARWFGDGTEDKPLIALVRKLLYPRGDGLCFSDYELVLSQTHSEEERLELVKSLSRQSAVLARIHIGADTDIDKLLGYWGRGIQVKDMRPLLESVARLQNGGTVSLLYFLPKFARERLYTFPMPSRAGDPAMDCHWSTMNFFNDPPSNAFTNTSYTASFLTQNYYQVAKPTLYGDVILVLDEHGNAIHSATYLADDLVFTKNGNNFSQPWMLMRLGDLLARYTADAPPKMLVYRSRNL
jgi:hypothetical protein